VGTKVRNNLLEVQQAYIAYYHTYVYLVAYRI